MNSIIAMFVPRHRSHHLQHALQIAEFVYSGQLIHAGSPYGDERLFYAPDDWGFFGVAESELIVVEPSKPPTVSGDDQS